MKKIIIEVPDNFGKTLKPEKVNCEIKGELVLCKDCYFGEHTINGAGEHCVQCTNSDLGMMGDCHTPNWYCADGERK